MTTEKETAPIELLSQDATAKLTEFARACKAASRAVTLYPPAHPAIRISLARLVDTTARMTEAGPVALGALPDNLLMDGRAAERPDLAVRETGALFHEHMIGVLTLHSSPDPTGWMPFLQLLAKPIAEIRAGGGISRTWAATGLRYLEIQEIDYADILRARGPGHEAKWDDVIRACLNVQGPDLSEEQLRGLVDVCTDPERFGEFVHSLEQTAEAGLESKASALMRMVRGVVDLVSRSDPNRLEPLLRNIAQGFGSLSPDLLLELLSTEAGRADAAANLVLQVAGRMTDSTLATFVARGVVAEGGATTRLAQAFQALVPDTARRPGVLDLARSRVAQEGGEAGEDLLGMWKNAADMLMSYKDEQFVGESYARELSGARTQALEVERVSDDPPDRIGAWITSVGPAEIRTLDLRLLLDLLTIESDPERWRQVTFPAISHIEDLLLVGDFEGAMQLVNHFAGEIKEETIRKEPATAAIARLVEGSMMWHVTSHLRTVDDKEVEQIKTLCYTVGPSVIKPLAESLAIEKRTASRQRLTQLLLGFGAAGRQSVEQLKASANPAVRRTAIYLLREFGGSEALPDLTALLDDAEPHIQREAVRAILLIGTEEAYGELQKALVSGTDRTREALMGALVAMRNERAIPLFEYIVQKIDRKGPLREVYLRAIESLGALHAEQAINVLKEALYSGEWWAPFRTRELRRIVATALHQIGSQEATRVLAEAAERGPRGVKHAVKAVLA